MLLSVWAQYERFRRLSVMHLQVLVTFLKVCARTDRDEDCCAALRHTSPTTGFQFYVTVDQQAATKALSPIQKFGSGFGYI
jgi:hypothetical protein